jgi:hypothetical protein
MNQSQYQKVLKFPIATIIAEGTLSSAVDVGGMSVLGIYTPASFVESVVSFQSSYDGETFHDVVDIDGTAFSVTLTASKKLPLEAAMFAGDQFIRIATTESQTTGALIRVALGPLFDAPNVG